MLSLRHINRVGIRAMPAIVPMRGGSQTNCTMQVPLSKMSPRKSQSHCPILRNLPMTSTLRALAGDHLHHLLPTRCDQQSQPQWVSAMSALGRRDPKPLSTRPSARSAMASPWWLCGLLMFSKTSEHSEILRS